MSHSIAVGSKYGLLTCLFLMYSLYKIDHRVIDKKYNATEIFAVSLYNDIDSRADLELPTKTFIIATTHYFTNGVTKALNR